MPLLPPSLARPARAAARLAAAYAAGVGVLVFAFGLIVAGIEELLGELAVLALPATAAFGLAFLLLIVARRAGFSALWLAALALWAWLALGPPPRSPEPDFAFVMWSLFAAPLYCIVRLGFRHPVRRPAWRRAAAAALAGGWVALALAGMQVDFWPSDPFAPGRTELAIRAFLGAAWRIAPVAITALAIWRIHRRDSLDSAGGLTSR